MNARTARRKRIIRVRSVEHQMAEANLARANGELANLVELAKRLETLRVDLAMAKGAVAGRALNSVGELAMRLDIAQESLTAPLSNASERRDQAGVLVGLDSIAVAAPRIDRQHDARMEEVRPGELHSPA